jgi:hypothetical protein
VDLHHLLLAGLPAHLCENVARYDCTGIFEACGHVQSKKMQKFVFRSALRPNQFSFSHSQDPERAFTQAQGCGRQNYNSVAQSFWLTPPSCGYPPSPFSSRGPSEM